MWTNDPFGVFYFFLSCGSAGEADWKFQEPQSLEMNKMLDPWGALCEGKEYLATYLGQSRG